MSARRKLGAGLGLALSALTLMVAATPAAQAQVDTSACTQDIQFDSSVRTWVSASAADTSPVMTPRQKAPSSRPASRFAMFVGVPRM